MGVLGSGRVGFNKYPLPLCPLRRTALSLPDHVHATEPPEGLETDQRETPVTRCIAFSWKGLRCSAVRSPCLTVAEVAERYRFPSLKEALRWLDAQKVPTKRRGRLILVRVEDTEAALKPRKNCPDE
jgi:hypothetical protein